MRRSAWTLALLAACAGGGEGDGKDPAGARIVRFEAKPAVVRAGQAATLEWEVSGATGVSIEPQVGLQPPSGSVQVNPFVTTDYTLRVESAAGPLKAVVRVEVQGGAPSIDAFTATPRTLMPGQSATLEWSTSNATHVVIEPGIGMLAARGTVSVSPMVTTTYRLTAVGEGSVSGEVQLVVASGNQPFILGFSASPQTVAPGTPVTLTWMTMNADSVTIDNNVGIQPANGQATVTPQRATTYTLTAVGPGGSANASVTVSITGGGDPVIVKFEATPTNVAPGGTVTLAWETDNATHTTISGVPGDQMAKGSLDVTPSMTTTYTLTAHGNGKQVTRDLTVTVAQAGAPVVLSFSASPQAILAGDTTTLSWRTQNTTGVDIDNGVGAKPADGSVQVSPRTTTTYTLTTRGGNGTATERVTVTVREGPPVVVRFEAQPASIVAGGNARLSWETTGATGVSIDRGVGTQPATGSVMVSPSSTTLYTLTASGPGGNTSALLTVTVTMAGAPVIEAFTVSPQQVAPGGTATLAWRTTGATEVRIDNGLGTQPTTGQTTITPGRTTTYTLSATGPGGTTTAQATLTVLSSGGDQCTNAIVINASGRVTGNTQSAVNDYDPGSGGCTGFAAAGPDIVYQIDLQSGDRLVASLAPDGASWDTSLYLVRSCGDVRASCVTGQDNGNPEEIDYTAATAGTYYLIVDGFRIGGAYTLDISLNTAPIPNDRCMGAIDATRGGMFSGTTRGAQNDYDPGASGCTRFAETAGDVAYAVDLAAGERLQASLTTPWDSALYLVRDCAMVTATCVAGQDDGNPEQVDFTATTAGRYFLVVDGFGQASGSFDLAVTVSPPVRGGDTCANAVPVPAGGGSFVSSTASLANDYSAQSCTGYPQAGPDQVYSMSLAAGDVVEVDAEFDAGLDGSVYAVTDCANAAMSCVAGADRNLEGRPEALRFVARTAAPHFLVVDAERATASGGHDLAVLTYTGETCATAAPLSFATTGEWFTTSGKVNDYSPNSGGCTRYTANGPDRAYSVRLRAGDQLQVTAAPSTSYDVSLYLVSSCSDVNGSCVAGVDSGTAGRVENLYALAQAAGSYNLVIDGFSGSNGTGTLTATVARGESCRDAYKVPPTGGTFRGTTTGYRNDYGISSSTGSCTGWAQVGPDAVYRIELDNTKRLTANLQASWDAALYLISDCAAAATSCLAGSDRGEPESITYTNSSGARRTYYLLVDSFLGSRSGNYTLEITIN